MKNMPRNMSFSLTTEQMRNRTKTVTRRLGWKFLKEGDLVNACVKCMGLKPGEKIERLGLIRIVSVSEEKLFDLFRYPVYGGREAKHEGFPELSGFEFVEMFCRHMKCDVSQVVTRIKFEHVDIRSHRATARK